jgi:hypothetical protein
MEHKYPENIGFIITNLEGVQSTWKFPKKGSCQDDCKRMGDLKIGEAVVLKHSTRDDERFEYFLACDDGLESDYMSEREIENIMGDQLVERLNKKEDTYIHEVKPKPPLEVTPRDIYELQRIQELTRALYDYSRYEELDLELMLKWADELDDRIFNLTQED